MISLANREEKLGSAAPSAPTAPAAAVLIPQIRHSHRLLPGGGRIFVTLSDGTPVGVLRYDLEQKDGLPHLLRAFANVVQERIDRAATPQS